MIKKLFKRKKTGKTGVDILMAMSKKEKKEFLSNDFIERMIKVEQRILSRFGDWVPYRRTKCYLNLTKPQRESYEKYLHSKKIKPLIIISILVLAALFVGFLNVRFTGNVINENVSKTNSPIISMVIISLVMIGISFMIISFVLRRMKEKRFEKNFQIIDDIASGRKK